MGCLTFDVKRLDALTISCALVCAVNTTGTKYLRVSPKDVQWVYPQVVKYEIESNTDWKVE